MTSEPLPAILHDKLHEEVEQFADRDFLKAVLGVSVLCALADDEISIEERFQIDDVLAQDPVLSTFDTTRATRIFDDFAEAVQIDPERARDVLMAKVKRIGESNAKQARTAMRAAWLIIAVDGTITMREDATFCYLCSLAGLEADIVRLGVETAW
ncbi:MAG: tellurite resistance TerB family protein [Rhodospirillaceae bacterium]|jgi:tellurite resistance protein|nr:tellurite resistance TerB family protein [Rhodospirillaceae bacterium]MBT6205765.1 tellurite resistance TerB family protein [Rhodospirillaceae bacterium]MBT6510665.1 tellurite resistance TerB family protein [Rhodospirillaceae bacterium]